MYTLTGKEDGSNIGCLFCVGILVICTTVALLSLLAPTIESADWFTGLSMATGVLTFCGIICILYPILWPDRLVRYLLAFILLSCLALQISLFSSIIDRSANSVIAATWTIHFRIGYAIFLVGFFIFTAIAYFRRDSSTREKISQPLLSVSEERVTIGKEFLIRYQLACKETTPIKSVSVTFAYQQHEGYSFNAGGYPGYEERTLPIYEKKSFVIDPSNPFIEEIPWTIPASLIPVEGTRKDWSLHLHIVPNKGVIIAKIYPLKVKWDWPESA